MNNTDQVIYARVAAEEKAKRDFIATTGKKLSCLFSIIATVLLIPVSAVSWYLLLQHVHATDAMWIIFWIGQPLSALLSLCMTIAREMTNPSQ